MKARRDYDMSVTEGACSLRSVSFTDGHRALINVSDPSSGISVRSFIDHPTAWFDTETGDLLVIAQPYFEVGDADRKVLSELSVAVLDLPDWLAPYRTSKGSAKTNAYLICKADRAHHYARLIRNLA